MICSCYGIQVHQLFCEQWCYVFQTALMWIVVLAEWSLGQSGLTPVGPGSSPTLPGGPRNSRRFLRCSEVVRVLSGLLVSHFCTTYFISQLLWQLAAAPFFGLILFWNGRFQVYTPHPYRHSSKLLVTKIDIAVVVVGHVGFDWRLLWLKY